MSINDYIFLTGETKEVSSCYIVDCDLDELKDVGDWLVDGEDLGDNDGFIPFSTSTSQIWVRWKLIFLFFHFLFLQISLSILIKLDTQFHLAFLWNSISQLIISLLVYRLYTW